LDETLTSPRFCSLEKCTRYAKYRVKPKGRVVSKKIRGLGQGESQVRPLILGIFPAHGAWPILKHKMNIIVNVNIHKSRGIGRGESSYTYCLRVSGRSYTYLFPSYSLRCRCKIPSSFVCKRNKFHEYKVLSNYTKIIGACL